MTNKDDEHDPRLAALLAVHLVGKILDEAYVIAIAAKDSGSPWCYLSKLRDIKSHNMEDTDSYIDPNGKSAGDNTIEQVINDVATSTPQKIFEETEKDNNDSSFLGQGDVVDLEMKQSSQNTSTSTYINKLFDMSEVERVLLDENDTSEKESIETITINEPDSVVPIFLGTQVTKTLDTDKDQSNEVVTESSESQSTDYSSQSLSNDAIGVSAVNDVAFYIDCDVTPETDRENDEDEEKKTEAKELGSNEPSTSKVDIEEIIEEKQIIEEEQEEIKLCDNEADKAERKNDTSFYENAYLTLNRDYEQCSDDECDPVLQDPKNTTLQEVNLISRHSSDEDIMARGDEDTKKHELASTSAVTATTTSSRRSTLSERFRSHGTRLLSCLRGLWRKRTPRKRMGIRKAGSVMSIGVLSPVQRRRGYLDPKCGNQSTSCGRSDWKFNTVNEGMINSRYPITEEYGTAEEKTELL